MQCLSVDIFVLVHLSCDGINELYMPMFVSVSIIIPFFSFKYHLSVFDATCKLQVLG